jgi:hypothetical protein
MPVEMELLRDPMQKVVLESHSYGYRRVTRELHRGGFEVNQARAANDARRHHVNQVAALVHPPDDCGERIRCFGLGIIVALVGALVFLSLVLTFHEVVDVL